jgi:hypothetical protein
MNYSNVTWNIALSKVSYSNLTRVLFNYLFFNPLINSKYFIFCLIFCNYSVLVKLLARVKNELLHIISRENLLLNSEPDFSRACFSLVSSTCNHMVTQITAFTTLTPTRKLNGKTRVHTVFYMDSIGQEMPSLVHCKIYSISTRLTISVTRCRFSTRATRLSTRVARAKIIMWLDSYYK